jgi:MraZ protein
MPSGTWIMFRGINTATLDGKGRLALPTRFREPLLVAADGRIVVTIDMREQCLLLYPLPEWEVVQRKLESLSNIAPNARRLQRLLIGHATDIDLDSQGRLLLPGLLRNFADLQKKLMLVGQGNKLEIWGARQWEERMSSWLSEDPDLLADGDEFTGLSV